MSGSRSSRVFIVAMTVIVALLLVVPTALMAIAAFSKGNVLTFPPQGLSLRWFVELAQERSTRMAFYNSLRVAVICTLLSVIVGVPASVALSRSKWALKPLVEMFLLLPFIIPAVVTAVGFLTLFGSVGLLGKPVALAVALCAFNLPFMIGAVTATASRLDPNLEDAAASCGAPPVERFLTVTLPSLMPGVISGALLLFVLTFNEYVVSSFLVDVRSMTVPVEVFNQGRGATTPVLAAISVVYFFLCLSAVVVVDRLVGIEAFFRSAH